MCSVGIFKVIVVFVFWEHYRQMYLQDNVVQGMSYIQLSLAKRHVTGHSIEARAYNIIKIRPWQNTEENQILDIQKIVQQHVQASKMSLCQSLLLAIV